MPLLTDLLATNTFNISANTTAVASAGGIVKIASSTANNSATITFSLPTSGYTYFKIAFDDFVNATSNEKIRGKVYGASGAGGTTNTMGYHVQTSGTNHELVYNTTGILVVPEASTFTDRGASGEMTIFGSMNSSIQPRGTFSMFMNYSNNISSYTGSWRGPYSEVQDSIEISSSFGNIYSGTATLYGVK